MNIAINLLPFRPDKIGGGEVYAMNLIRALAAEDKQNRYFLFVTPENAERYHTEAKNFALIVCPVGQSIKKRVFWEHFILPIQLRKLKASVVHFWGNTISFWSPIPVILTIHDLSWHFYDTLFPNSVSKSKIIYLRHLVSYSARRALKIITDSGFSKRELISVLGLPASKITVIPLAGRDEWQSAFHNSTLRKNEPPIILSVATMSLHKNLITLLKAFQSLKISYKIPHQLVLIGMPGIGYETILEQVHSVRSDVLVTGRVSDAELFEYYQKSDLYVFPSLYEGFGIPVLEAMQNGVPVVCSNTASLPEVAGNAAVLFNPMDVNSLIDAILSVLNSPEKRQQLIDLGIEQAMSFSWRRTAQETLKVYQQVNAER